MSQDNIFFLKFFFIFLEQAMPYRRRPFRRNFRRRPLRRRYKKRTSFKYPSQNRGLVRVSRPMTSGIQYLKMRTSWTLRRSAFAKGSDSSLSYLFRMCPQKNTVPGYISKLDIMKNFYAWYKPVKAVIKFTRPKQPLNTEEENAVLSRVQIRGGTQMLHPQVFYASDGAASDSMVQKLEPYAEAVYPTTWNAAIDNTSDRFMMHNYGGATRTWMPMTQYEKRWSQFTSSDNDHSYGTLLFMLQEDAYTASTAGDGSSVTVVTIPDEWHLIEGTIEYTFAFRTRL